MQDVSADKTTVLLLFLWTQIEFSAFNSRKLANILQTEAEDERTALKFETARNHFLSECFHVTTADLIQFKTVEARGGEIVGGKT